MGSGAIWTSQSSEPTDCVLSPLGFGDQVARGRGRLSAPPTTWVSSPCPCRVRMAPPISPPAGFLPGSGHTSSVVPISAGRPRGWGACTAMGRGVTPSPPSHTQTPGTARSPWTRALASQPGFRVVGYRVSQGLPPSPGKFWGVERMGVLVLDPPVSTTHMGTTGGEGRNVPLWILTCICQSFYPLVLRPVGGYHPDPGQGPAPAFTAP